MSQRNDKELRAGIEELVRRARRVYPKLRVEVQIPGYEDQDALLILYCPAKLEEKIAHALYETWYRLLEEKDIFIGKQFRSPREKPKLLASARLE